MNIPVRFKSFGALFASLFLLNFVSAETIDIHGSSTVNNSFLRDAKSRIENLSGLVLQIIPNGSGSGISDLAIGAADIAMISSSLESVAVKLNVKRPGFIDTDDYKIFPLKETEAFFITHPSNPVSELTGEQIAKLLSGEITNWSEVGGPDKPVLVITMIPGDGVRSAVESEFLKKYNRAFTDQARVVPSANQTSSIVSQIPHAIGIASSASLTPSIKTISTDAKVVQNLYLVTKGEPNSLIDKVIKIAQSL